MRTSSTLGVGNDAVYFNHLILIFPLSTLCDVQHCISLYISWFVIFVEHFLTFCYINIVGKLLYYIKCLAEAKRYVYNVNKYVCTHYGIDRLGGKNWYTPIYRLD